MSVMRLLERDDSVLIVVDVQPGFYGVHPQTAPGGPAGAADPATAELVARVAWLVGVARALGVPVVVTEEDPARNGPTAPPVSTRLPADTRVFGKAVFGLADDPPILAAVERTGRRTAVLVGMETDVCVAHSALGLLDRGYRVAVVTDATFSPGATHGQGLRRVAEAGALLVHAKGVYYEWVRTLEAARTFEAANPDLAEPPGFAL
jgi:nicotinamidase-related amidase